MFKVEHPDFQHMYNTHESSTNAEVCMKIIYKINDMELMYHSRLFVSLNSGNIKQSRGSKF